MSDYISREAALTELQNPELFNVSPRFLQILRDLPAADVEPVRHGRWIYSKKHLWYKNKNGEIDMWRLDIGFHNGPECQVCHASFCEYCTPNFDDEECDVGHYYCSECKAAQLDNHNTDCPNCGAKMDLEDETNDD